MSTSSLSPPRTVPKHPLPVLIPANSDSLTAWVRHYGTYEASANAANTVRAKAGDLTRFLDFFATGLDSDHPDDWTKPVTQAFLRHLEDDLGHKPATVNRAYRLGSRHLLRQSSRRPLLSQNRSHVITIS